MWRALTHPRAPVLGIALLGAAYLIVAPPSADMAGHAYRTWLWERDPFAVWNSQWYGGHHVLGYSVLFPPLSAALGAGLVGVLAGGAATWLFGLAVRRRVAAPGRAAAAIWLFAIAVASHVAIGRMPFALGLACALGAWVCADHRARGPAAVLALASVWSSPVAGGLLILAAAGRALHGERGTALALAAPALAGGLAMTALFPEGGVDRFTAGAFWPMLAVSLAGLALLDPRRGAVRFAVALYVVLLAASFALPNPLGQNTLRYGVTLLPPLLVLAGRRLGALGPRAALAVVLGALVYLQWLPAVRAVREAQRDPSVHADFQHEAMRVLVGAVRPGERVEVPLTRNHWEAAYMARLLPLARGWERQLDRKVNPLFYDGERLTPRRYADWLRRTGVRWVALPSAPLDVSATDEGRLLRTRLPYLRAVYRSPRWWIWRVEGIPEPARLALATSDGFGLAGARRGTVRVNERHTPYWTVVEGAACVSATPDGFTEVDVRRPGPVRVEARLSLRGALRRPEQCRAAG